MSEPTGAGGRAPPSLAEIAALVGDEDAERLLAIQATGANLAEIEKALLWAQGEAEVLARRRIRSKVPSRPCTTS